MMNELNVNQMQEVNGGFVCGGLCIAGAGFAAGAIFGAGVTVGIMSEL